MTIVDKVCGPKPPTQADRQREAKQNGRSELFLHSKQNRRMRSAKVCVLRPTCPSDPLGYDEKHTPEAIFSAMVRGEQCWWACTSARKLCLMPSPRPTIASEARIA